MALPKVRPLAPGQPLPKVRALAPIICKLLPNQQSRKLRALGAAGYGGSYGGGDEEVTGEVIGEATEKVTRYYGGGVMRDVTEGVTKRLWGKWQEGDGGG